MTQTPVGRPDVVEIWTRYRETQDQAARDLLIEAHLPLVNYVARRMIGSLHSSVELQDLVSYGVFGLIDAIKRFDPEAGVQFSTFATYRIKGAINDEMRSQAWEPRSVRARFRQVQAGASELEHKLLRPPTEEELATHVGISLDELRRREHDMRASWVGSIHATTSGEDSALLVEDTIAAQDLGDLAPQMGEMTVLLADAMCRLPGNERVLLQLIYVEHLTFKLIASTLEVTESWVSHLHTRAMVNLQRTMSAQY